MKEYISPRGSQSSIPESGYGGIYQRGVQTVEEVRPVELDTNHALLPGDENPGVTRQSDLVQAVAQLVLEDLPSDSAHHPQKTGQKLSADFRQFVLISVMITTQHITLVFANLKID